MNQVRYKYKRTYHLPWPPGATSDDKILPNTACFEGKIVVITEKMDGENTTMYRDGFHARSLDSRDHPSRSWCKQLHGTIKNDIPEGWRICGENLYAKHSIAYDNLKSYFYCFSIWDENNYCLSWVDTVEWCNMLGIETVPVKKYNFLWPKHVQNMEEYLKDYIISPHVNKNEEGYVIRNAHKFHYDDFQTNVAKWVRKNHVQTDQHWMYSEVIPNQLIKIKV